MVRQLSAVAVGVVCTVLFEAVGVSWQAQEIPRFRSGVQLIEVDARVTDRDGKVVRDLTKEDFTLLDDGVPQKIATAAFVDLAIESPVSRLIPGAIEPDVVSNGRSGRMWVLLLGGWGEQARRVAREFVEEALGPNDQVAVVPVHGTMSSAQGFTRSRRLLLAAIDRLHDDGPRDGERNTTGPMAPDRVGSPTTDESTRIAFQVLEDLCRRLAVLSGGRKSVIFFDPPAVWIPASLKADPGGLEHAMFFAQRDALRCATRNNVAVSVVSTQGLTTDLGNLVEMAAQRVIAEDTGGDAIVNSNDFDDGFRRFVRDSNQYYLLGYVPTVEHRDGEFHNVTIRVNRPGLTVRARRGYYAPDAERAPAPEPSAPSEPAGLSAGAREALRLPLSMNGLTIELSAAPFRGTAGNGSVLLTAQVRGGDLVLGPGEPIEVAYQAMTTEGVVSPGAFHVFELDLSEASRATVESTGLRFVEWLPLPRGRHQIRFAVHQPNGKTGMVVGDVEVPDFVDATMSMSGLVLASDRLRTQRTMKMDDALLKLLGGYPTAERSFARRDVLTAYAEVYTKAQTRPPAIAATITRANGVSDAPRTTPRLVVAEPGRAGYLARMPLDTLRPGDYVLRLEARDGRQAATRQVLFTVTAD